MPLSDKIYTSLCAFFSVLIVVGNLIYQKFVALPLLPFHTFELSAGAVLYLNLLTHRPHHRVLRQRKSQFLRESGHGHEHSGCLNHHFY